MYSVLSAVVRQSWWTIRDLPNAVREVWHDSLRLWHLLGRSIEGGIGGAVLGLWFLPYGPIIGAIVVPLVEYLVYEYGLEPIAQIQVKRGWKTIVGPYWERGPYYPVIAADGSVAERGEVFRDETEAVCRFIHKTWKSDPFRPSGGWCE